MVNRQMSHIDDHLLTSLCQNSRHRTARVSKRMPFGAATVRERTQRPIFRQNAPYFSWFPNPPAQAPIATRAVAGVFRQTLTRAARKRIGTHPASGRCAPVQSRLCLHSLGSDVRSLTVTDPFQHSLAVTGRLAK